MAKPIETHLLTAEYLLSLIDDGNVINIKSNTNLLILI